MLLLETAFVCLSINFEESVQFKQFVPKCCLTIEYKMVSFPHENVQSVQFVDVSSVPECCLRGITWNQKLLHAVNNKSKYLLIDSLLSNKLREMPKAKLSNLLMDILDKLLKEEPMVSRAQTKKLQKFEAKLKETLSIQQDAPASK